MRKLQRMCSWMCLSSGLMCPIDPEEYSGQLRTDLDRYLTRARNYVSTKREVAMKSAQTLPLLIFSLILISPSMAIADVVTDWNTAALNAIRANRTSPPEASRTLAILHVAIYDAINGIDRRHEPYFVRS